MRIFSIFIFFISLFVAIPADTLSGTNFFINFEGKWSSTGNGAMSIMLDERILRVNSRDDGSSIKVTCSIDAVGTQASCVGEGKNRGNSDIFIYQSQMKLNGSDQIIEE